MEENYWYIQEDYSVIDKSPLKRKKGLGTEMVESLATMIDGRKALLEIEKEKFEYMKKMYTKKCDDVDVETRQRNIVHEQNAINELMTSKMSMYGQIGMELDLEWVMQQLECHKKTLRELQKVIN